MVLIIFTIPDLNFSLMEQACNQIKRGVGEFFKQYCHFCTFASVNTFCLSGCIVACEVLSWFWSDIKIIDVVCLSSLLNTFQCYGHIATGRNIPSQFSINIYICLSLKMNGVFCNKVLSPYLIWFFVCLT